MCKKRLQTKSIGLFDFWLCIVCSVGQHRCLIVRSSEGLVLFPGVKQVVLMVWVVEVVGLVTMMAVADYGVFNAFTLQVLLLLNTLQLPQQLLDESLRRSATCQFLLDFYKCFPRLLPSAHPCVRACVSAYPDTIILNLLMILQICERLTRCFTGFSIEKNVRTQVKTKK